jgi:hypothetical protein
LEVKERGGGWSWSSGTVSESMTGHHSHGHCVVGRRARDVREWGVVSWACHHCQVRETGVR